MDVGVFTRNIIVHWRGVLVGSLVIGLLVSVASLLLPGRYVAESTLRVIPPAGQLDADSLATAVDWYTAVETVPSIAQAAGAATRPALTAEEVGDQSTLTVGKGPGEIVVRATASDAAQAMSLSGAMASAVVAGVTANESLQVADTTVSILVPAQEASRVGSGPLTLFLTGFLLGLVLLATGAALLHRHLNWRLTPRILASLTQETGIPAISDTRELAAFLALKGREGPQAWLAAGDGVSDSWWAELRAAVHGLGGATEVVVVSSQTEAVAPAPGMVYFPRPNDGNGLSVAAASATGAPALIVCARGQRARSLRALLGRMSEFGITPLVIGTVGGRARNSRA